MTTESVVFVRGQQSDKYLKLSLDRKVSPTGWYQQKKSRWVPRLPNSFGLPAGESCPGKTPFCASCYAAGSEIGRGVHQLVSHNYRMLLDAGTVEAMSALLVEMLGRFVAEAKRQGVDKADLVFRIHWDGDFFSRVYAQAWARAIKQFPDVKFWAYTRSFTEPINVVDILAGIDNLALYLSVDQWNTEAARVVLAQHPSVLAAPCAFDYQSGRQLLPERSAMICPENAGRVELMSPNTAKGTQGNGRGACVSCRLCTDGKRDILFATSGEEVSAQPALFDSFLAGYCQNPDCRAPLLQEAGKPKPRKWCSPECRKVIQALNASGR